MAAISRAQRPELEGSVYILEGLEIKPTFLMHRGCNHRPADELRSRCIASLFALYSVVLPAP